MKHICLLYGGNGREREVSILSKNSISEQLAKMPYKVTELDFDGNFIANIQALKPDVVFNAMHGTWGEDGRAPLLLDFLKTPYTHSGFKASVMAMNKQFTKELAKSLGIKTPNGYVATKEQLLTGNYAAFPQSFIKPLEEGSSVGCFKFEGRLSAAQIKTLPGEFFLIEEYFEGFDVTVAVMGEKAIGAVEIRPKTGFYDLHNKYTAGATEYFNPPRIPPELLAELKHAALNMHKALGASAISRSDFMVNTAQTEYRFLELNTHPGFTSTSLVPKIAGFGEAIEFLIENAKFESYEQ